MATEFMINNPDPEQYIDWSTTDKPTNVPICFYCGGKTVPAVFPAQSISPEISCELCMQCLTFWAEFVDPHGCPSCNPENKREKCFSLRFDSPFRISWFTSDWFAQGTARWALGTGHCECGATVLYAWHRHSINRKAFAPFMDLTAYDKYGNDAVELFRACPDFIDTGTGFNTRVGRKALMSSNR